MLAVLLALKSHPALAQLLMIDDKSALEEPVEKRACGSARKAYTRTLQGIVECIEDRDYLKTTEIGMGSKDAVSSFPRSSFPRTLNRPRPCTTRGILATDHPWHIRVPDERGAPRL